MEPEDGPILNQRFVGTIIHINNAIWVRQQRYNRVLTRTQVSQNCMKRGKLQSLSRSLSLIKFTYNVEKKLVVSDRFTLEPTHKPGGTLQHPHRSRHMSRGNVLDLSGLFDLLQSSSRLTKRKWTCLYNCIIL